MRRWKRVYVYVMNARKRRKEFACMVGDGDVTSRGGKVRGESFLVENARTRCIREVGDQDGQKC